MEIDYPPAEAVVGEEAAAALQHQHRQPLTLPDAGATDALLAIKVSQATQACAEFRALVSHSAEEVRGVLLEERRQHPAMLACHPPLAEAEMATLRGILVVGSLLVRAWFQPGFPVSHLWNELES